MLTFIGLGLFDERDISLKGLEAIARANRIYAEFYTSRLMGTTLEKMEGLYNKKIEVLTREEVEQHPSWLDHARNEDVVFLTGGDTMVSTTHVDLRLRAMEMGITTKLVHGSSISSAVCGLTGLQNYRFGKAVTVPYPFTSSRGRTVISETPYDTILQNLEHGLHTLVFLDIDKEKGYMTVNQALDLLLQVEAQRSTIMLENRIAVGIARAGSDSPAVAADYIQNLKNFDLGAPLHILVIPADTHFVEAEALVQLAHAPKSILEVHNQ